MHSRNDKPEAIRLTWKNKRLEESITNTEKSPDFNGWVLDQREPFTRKGAVEATGLSLGTVKTKIEGLLKAGVLKRGNVGMNNEFNYSVRNRSGETQ